MPHPLRSLRSLRNPFDVAADALTSGQLSERLALAAAESRKGRNSTLAPRLPTRPKRMPRTHVKLVGAELEGAWLTERWHNREYLPHFRGDASVAIQQEPRYIIGEVASPPVPIAALFGWLLRFYPNVVNDSCGLHVHMSLKSDVDYARLVDVEYAIYLKRGLIGWGERAHIKNSAFWARLDGKNDYCRTEFDPLPPFNLQGRPGNRYTAVNYPFEEHGTVEVRILPMFKDPKIALSAVRHVVDLTDLFFASHKIARLNLCEKVSVSEVQRAPTVVALSANITQYDWNATGSRGASILSDDARRY